MQEILELKLWQIREILRTYEAETDWARIVTLLANLGDLYPREEEDYNGISHPIEAHIAVHTVLIDWLKDGKPFAEISVIDAEQEADKPRTAANIESDSESDYDAIFASDDEIPLKKEKPPGALS